MLNLYATSSWDDKVCMQVWPLIHFGPHEFSTMIIYPLPSLPVVIQKQAPERSTYSNLTPHAHYNGRPFTPRNLSFSELVHVNAWLVQDGVGPRGWVSNHMRSLLIVYIILPNLDVWNPRFETLSTCHTSYGFKLTRRKQDGLELSLGRWIVEEPYKSSPRWQKANHPS